MDVKNFATQIQTTGFPLEHKIASLLRDAGWSVIANKYYIDDLEQSVREVDLVAYRVRNVYHFAVYTTLIISCKKSEKNAWVLLSRPTRAPDPNTDFEPFHAWSNDGPLKYMFSQTGWSANYYQRVRELGVRFILDAPVSEIFAFQEMDRESGKPHNDKAIFSAVTSLMKAQAYELDALPKRRKEPAIYCFSLLSVVDSDIVRLDFCDGSTNATATAVAHELYVARYIINRQQTFARISFVTADYFSTILSEYNKLHDANCKLFGDSYDDFLVDIFNDHARWRVLLDQFCAEIEESIWRTLINAEVKAHEAKASWFSLRNGKLYITLDIDDEEDGRMRAITSSDSVRRATEDALKKVYRYDGDFEFEASMIPF
jgi:hypothetical protein